MSTNIPTRYNALRSDVNPFPPPHKRLKYIDTNYPTGVNGLTTDILQHRNVTTHDGGQSNETVDITRYSRGQAAEGLTAGQLVFVDKQLNEIDSYMSLHEVNRILASFNDLHIRTIASKNGDPLSTHRNKLASTGAAIIEYICKRFNFIGILSSNDTPVGRLKGTKAINISVFGETRVFDYWSYGNQKKVRAYDSCYLVLRQVRADHNEFYQNAPHGNPHDAGFQPKKYDNKDYEVDVDTAIWQFVPVFNSRDVVTKEDMPELFNTEMFTSWRIGRIHEFPTLPASSASNSRDFRTTSKSALKTIHGSCHTTIQFKMNCKKL